MKGESPHFLLPSSFNFHASDRKPLIYYFLGQHWLLPLSSCIFNFSFTLAFFVFLFPLFPFFFLLLLFFPLPFTSATFRHYLIIIRHRQWHNKVSLEDRHTTLWFLENYLWMIYIIISIKQITAPCWLRPDLTPQAKLSWRSVKIALMIANTRWYNVL